MGFFVVFVVTGCLISALSYLQLYLQESPALKKQCPEDDADYDDDADTKL